MKPERLNGSFVPKSLNEEERTIDVTWSTGARVRRKHPEYGPFYEEISLDPNHIRMERLQNGAPVLDNHNDEKLFDQIGVVVRAWVENGVGRATLKFSKRADVEPIWEDVKAGIFRNISVGYKPYKSIEIEQENDYPILRSVDTEFFEISLVPINAEAGAQVRSEESIYELELLTTRKEPDMPVKKKEEKTDLTPKTPTVTEPKNTPPKAKDDPLDTRALPKEDPAELLLSERRRIRAIEDRCQNHGMSAEFTRKLVDEGISETRANKLILDELTKRSLDEMIQNQGRTSHIYAGDLDEIQTRRESMKNGILMSVDQRLVKPDDIHDDVRMYSRKSIPQIIAMELERRGERVSNYSDDELVTRAFHTTSDFPLVMGLAGEAAVLKSYLNLVKQQTFRPIVRYENAKNFLPMRKMRMGEIPTLEKLPESATVSYGTISEAAEQWAIGKYGTAFAASYELMVNDQRNLIFSAMTMYGAAAANLESNLVWNIFKTNPPVYDIDAQGNRVGAGIPWFHADHKNLSDAALTHDALEEAEYMMSIQKGLDAEQREGDELNIIPRFLITGTRLKNTAKRLIYSQYNPTQVQDVNIYQNRFDVISEARLNPRNPTANSKYPWYLSCDPDVLPVLWMAYLNDRREPRTMQKVDFDTLSIKIRADLDFGVTTGDWKAVHKSKGATIAAQKEANRFIVPKAEVSA